MKVLSLLIIHWLKRKYIVSSNDSVKTIETITPVFEREEVHAYKIAELLEYGCIGVEQLPPRYRTKLGL